VPGADWRLPAIAEIGGRAYTLNTDYRDVLEIISWLECEPDKRAATHIALALFFEEYGDMPPEHMPEAVRYLESFLGCFEADDAKPGPKSIDWEQDYNMIAAEINKVAGAEVRTLPHLHWFTFVGYFCSIGDGQLATVVSIRHKLRKGKKLEKWEQEFYREHKPKIDFRVKHTPEEQAEIDRINALLGR
jgi:hypothetical protein